MRHIVAMSYGLGSWAAGKLVVRDHGVENTTLLFTDTKYEDEDTYRWGAAAAANIGAPLVQIAEGRDVWQLFFDAKFIGNTRVDNCSRTLKREMLLKWLKANCDPADTVVHFGIHWSEKDRFEQWDKKRGQFTGIKPRMAALGWTASAPLCVPPLLGAEDLHAWAEREGLWKQALYQEGFAHANCGGRCVKQGQGGWMLLLEKRRESFLEVEAKEQEFRNRFGLDVAILRDRRGGTTKPLTLLQLRMRVEGGKADECDSGDMGGCNCFGGIEE